MEPCTPVSFSGSGVTIRGDRWSTEFGRGEVLFLHGGGQTRHAWGAGAERLAAVGWNCTTVDLRGHGESGWDPTGAYDIYSYVADVRSVCTELGGQVVLVGASLGGVTSMLLASEPGDLVRALVLVDIAPRVETEGIDRIREFMVGNIGGFDSLEDVGDAVAEYTGRARSRNLEGLKKNVRQHDDGRWYWHWDPAIMVPNPREEPRPGITGEQLRELARQIRVPVLMVRGGASDVISEASVEELLEAIPSASVVVVPGAGHMVAGDDNDVFVSAVEDFLATRV